MDGIKYSIIVPAYDEEGNLRDLVDDLSQLPFTGVEYEIIIVDDNSTDGTPTLCDELSESSIVYVIHRRAGKNGMGYALLDGTSSARGDYIFWVMGDRSDKLESIPAMVCELDKGYDMVMASRYMPGGSRGDLMIHKALYGSIYTTLARWLFGIPVHDITNAFRGFKREVFDKARPTSGDFAISPEFAIRAQLAGFKLTEVPTTYVNRRAGQPKFSIFKMSLRYLSLFTLKWTGNRR